MIAKIKVTNISHGYLHGIDVVSGSKEDFHYASKAANGFFVYDGCIVVAEYSKKGHKPKQITQVLSCTQEKRC